MTELKKAIKECLDANYSDGDDRSGTDDKIILGPDQLQEGCEDLIEFLVEFDYMEIKKENERENNSRRR